MQEKDRQERAMRCRQALIGLTPPFIIAEVMFIALSVYLFVSFPQKPQFGGVFAALAGVLAAVYAAAALILRSRAKKEKTDKNKKP